MLVKSSWVVSLIHAVELLENRFVWVGVFTEASHGMGEAGLGHLLLETHEHREAQADAKAYSQNYEWFKMPENEEQEVRGESLWPEMRWKCRQKPNHGRSLSSGIQATSKSSSSVPRVWLYLHGAEWLPELQPLHTFIHLHIYTGTVSSDGSSHTRPESWLWLELPAGLLATWVRVSLHYFVGQSLIPD